MALATISLPLPVSPSIKTGTSQLAYSLIVLSVFWKIDDDPTRFRSTQTVDDVLSDNRLLPLLVADASLSNRKPNSSFLHGQPQLSSNEDKMVFTNFETG